MGSPTDRRLRARAPGLATGVALVAALAACGGPVDLPDDGLEPGSAAACRAVVDALPPTLSDAARVESSGAPGAAYEGGLTVRCGVVGPATLDQFSTCQTVNGVDWYVPESAIEDQDAEVVATTIARAPRVELVVPGDQRPPAGALAGLTEAVRDHTSTTGPGCV